MFLPYRQYTAFSKFLINKQPANRSRMYKLKQTYNIPKKTRLRTSYAFHINDKQSVYFPCYTRPEAFTARAIFIDEPYRLIGMKNCFSSSWLSLKRHTPGTKIQIRFVRVIRIVENTFSREYSLRVA